VVKLYEIYEDEEFFYMVLEMMTGGEVPSIDIFKFLNSIKAL